MKTGKAYHWRTTSVTGTARIFARHPRPRRALRYASATSAIPASAAAIPVCRRPRFPQQRVREVNRQPVGECKEFENRE